MTGKPDTRIEALTQKHATLDRFVSTLAAQVANVDNRLAADKLKKIIDRFDELELTVVELYGYYQAIFDELARIRARHRELVERFESYARDGVYVDADELADGIQVPARGLPVAGGAAALNDDELDKIALGLES